MQLFEKLRKNRPKSICVNECVARRSGYFNFSEDGLNSGLTAFRALDEVENDRDGSGERRCRTLTEIIDEHLGSQARINYLSLDTEGTELEILQSMDFKRHPIDILSIELLEWRDQGQIQRTGDFLRKQGYMYVDRLIADEIWIQRKGLQQDPGCVLPAARLPRPFKYAGQHGGWGAVRDVLRYMYNGLAVTIVEGKREEALEVIQHLMHNPLMNSSFAWGVAVFEASDQTEGTCPFGVLSIAVASSLLSSRRSGGVLDPVSMTTELRHQLLFRSSSQVEHLIHKYNIFDEITASEEASTEFHVHFPLGRSWNEITFLDVLVSGWPLFGLLDVTARMVGTVWMYDKIKFRDNVYHFPLKVPEIMCQLDLGNLEKGLMPALIPLTRSKRRGQSRTDVIVRNADACSLLGVAAASVHSARAALQKALSIGAAEFINLVNWSAPCRTRAADELRSLAPDRKGKCAALPHEVCAAVSQSGRAVPRRCLKNLRPSPGESLLVRRGPKLQFSKVEYLLDQAERLFREFVHRYGIYAAVWATAQPELAPKSPSGSPETLFSVLQSMQDTILEQQGLSVT